MNSRQDIYRAAHALIERHGKAARDEATRRALQYRDAGDEDARMVWLWVLEAVRELQSQRASDGGGPSI